MAAREQFFTTLVLSVMLRNGDAHLKNFGVVYPTPHGTVELAPVYDVVTTTVYISKDVPALTIEGTKKWWPRKVLERFALAHLSLPVKKVSDAFANAAEAVMETRRTIPGYISDHPEFREIGERMMTEWEKGVKGLAERQRQ